MTLSSFESFEQSLVLFSVRFTSLSKTTSLADCRIFFNFSGYCPKRLVSKIAVNSDIFTINPDSRETTTPLIVTCASATRGNVPVTKLKISRSSNNGTSFETLALADESVHNGDAQLTTPKEGWTVSGSAGKAYMRLTIGKLWCDDSGTYACMMSFAPIDASGFYSHTSSRRVTVTGE